MIPANLKKLLNKNEFLVIATSSLDGKPNAAPMFLVKADDKAIYLVDYALGTTWRNLEVNPQVSLSVSDLETLKGFKLNGMVDVIKAGPLHKEILSELGEKVLTSTADRIISALKKNIKHKDFEIGMFEKFVVYQIKVKEIVEIGPKGTIQRL